MPIAKLEPKMQAIVKGGKVPFQLIIIGGGPAGLAAGLYARRSRIDTLLIEKAVLGGLITSTESIENYPGFPEGISGFDLGSKFEEQTKNYGLDVVYGKVTGIRAQGAIKEVLTEDHSYSAKALIIATGSEPKKLDVPGEDKFIGKGVSYCATCDGPFYKDKHVAVIGGGNAALEEALFLTRFARLITIIHRRDELRADKVLQEKAKSNAKIFFKLSSVLEEIEGDTHVTSIRIKDISLNKISSINVDGVFIYAGLKPNTNFLKDAIKLDESGHVITDDKLATNAEGVFAAGDVRVKTLRQVVTAVSDGAIAASSVKNYLENLK